MWKSRWVFVLGVLVVIVAGYQQPAVAQQDVELKLNEPAPTFVLRSLNDDEVFLRDFCGELRQPWKNKTKHVVILSFFTSYCQPCRKEIPELQAIVAQDTSQTLTALLVNLKEEKELVAKYAADMGFTLPVLLDRYGMIAKKYGVSSVPRIFIIDKEGKLVWMTKGYDEKLGENIKAALTNVLK
jgi:thiol-disulfide isomerase/thioredoxin